jgi:glycine C-acetyltransferase
LNVLEAARKEIVDILRQLSRPYLFSNSMALSIVEAAIKILDMISTSSQLRDQLEYNTKLFRSEM